MQNRSLLYALMNDHMHSCSNENLSHYHIAFNLNCRKMQLADTKAVDLIYELMRIQPSSQ